MLIGRIKAPPGSYSVQRGLVFHYAYVFRQLWNKLHKRLPCILFYVKSLLSINSSYTELCILCTYVKTSMWFNNQTSFEPIHCINQSIFLKHPVMSALEIMLANLHIQSAIYRDFRSLDTAVLFVIECLSLLQTRIWSHSVFAFSFSWSLLNRLSDMPD